MNMLALLAPTLVLVHGANFSSASWKWVQADLAQTGFQSVAPQLYGPSEKVDLPSAASRLCTVLASIHSPIVLVGHSQGGAIVTEAAAECPQRVKELIYVAAVVPQPGTGVFDLLSDADNAYYGQCGVLDGASQTYVLKGLNPCRQVFFADAPSSLAEAYFGTMESEPAGIGNSKADYTASRLNGIPRYYIETLEDKIISPPTQEKIMAQVPLSGVFKLDSSHTPFFRDHQELTNILESLRQPGGQLGLKIRRR